MSIQDIQEEVQARNKFIANLLPTPSTDADHRSLFSQLDKAFADEQNANRVAKFNEKLAKFNLKYNPNGEKSKFANGCVECTTLTGIITRLCENYGCVVENFTTKFASDNCNDLVVENVTPISKTLVLGQTAIQDISGTTADSNCVRIPMVPMTPYILVSREALCSCTALDKMLLAIEKMMMTMQYALDKAVLYGKLVSGNYVAVPQFDSIDLLIPAGQKKTASGTTATFTEIAKAVANIQLATGCSSSDIQILMNEGVMTLMRSGLDNNDRPITTELMAMGVDCANMSIACVKVMPCQSVNTTVVGNTITSDIWVGMKKDYIFGEYEFAPIEPMFDQTTLKHYKVVKDAKYAGKLMNTNSFYKITATF